MVVVKRKCVYHFNVNPKVPTIMENASVPHILYNYKAKCVYHCGKLKRAYEHMVKPENDWLDHTSSLLDDNMTTLALAYLTT